MGAAADPWLHPPMPWPRRSLPKTFMCPPELVAFLFVDDCGHDHLPGRERCRHSQSLYLRRTYKSLRSRLMAQPLPGPCVTASSRRRGEGRADPPRGRRRGACERCRRRRTRRPAARHPGDREGLQRSDPRITDGRVGVPAVEVPLLVECGDCGGASSCPPETPGCTVSVARSPGAGDARTDTRRRRSRRRCATGSWTATRSTRSGSSRRVSRGSTVRE